VTIYDRDVATPHSKSVPVEAIELGIAEGMTQREVAAHLGIAQSTVSKYVNRARLILPGSGRSILGSDTLKRILA